MADSFGAAPAGINRPITQSVAGVIVCPVFLRYVAASGLPPVIRNRLCERPPARLRSVVPELMRAQEAALAVVRFHEPPKFANTGAYVDASRVIGERYAEPKTADSGRLLYV